MTAQRSTANHLRRLCFCNGPNPRKTLFVARALPLAGDEGSAEVELDGRSFVIKLRLVRKEEEEEGETVDLF